jgi:Fe-S-cluster containining protein
MNDEMTPLLLDDRFCFECSKDCSCFNECCKDINQFLTPYDILRLKGYLKITSSVFLEQYTNQHTGPETGLPIITLKTDNTDKLSCPFVTPSGCSVYDNRPSSCRTYPLARLASRSRETGEITEYYALMEEPHCKGFQQDKSQSVGQWIEDQEIAIYNEMNDLLMEVISLKNRLLPDPLDMKSRHLFHIACYDLDRFRSLIFEKGLLDDENIDTNTLDLVKESDEELLKLGLKWVKKAIFKI